MKARRIKGLDPAEPLVDNAAKIVRVRLDELRSLAPGALEPDNVEDLHDMRIAAKRLRYALEVTEFCFGRKATKARRTARDLQDLLGEIRDCDVMLPRVLGHLEDLRDGDADRIRARARDATDLDPRIAARARHRTAYRGLDVLAVYLKARRELLFKRFTQLWPELDRQGVWRGLEAALRNPETSQPAT